MATKIRWQRSLKGENAEVLIVKPTAYTTQADLKSFQANAAEGEMGLFNNDTGLLIAGTGFLSPPNQPAINTNTGAGLITANTYFYKITALNAVGESLGSAEVSITTTTATSQVTLSWNAVPGATSYRVYRGTATNTQDHYQATAATNFVDGSAAGGTAGTVPVTPTAVVTATPLTEGTNYVIVVKQDGNSFRSTVITYIKARTKKTPYQAPVKQVATITFPAGYTAVVGDDFEICMIEVGQGNEPYPQIAYDAQVTSSTQTQTQLLQKVVDRINNPLDIVHRDDGQQYTASLATDGGGNNTITITAFYFGQIFRLALRGPLSATGTITYTTPYKLGSGFTDHVLALEAEGWVFRGVTTNYPLHGVPADYGLPTSFVVAGITYNIFQLDPLRVSKEPMPQSVHHHYAHIYLVVPVPVGGNPTQLAASSPDLAISTILGF